MSRTRAAKSKARATPRVEPKSAAPAAVEQRGGRRNGVLATGVLAIVVLVAAAVGLRAWRAAHAPVPAVVAFRGDDPVVEQAIAAARQDVLDDPYDAPTWGRFGKVLLAHDYASEAVEVFAQAEQLDPGEPRWPYFAALAVGGERSADAIPMLRSAVERLGRDPDPVPRLRLAEALLRGGQLDDAERVLRDVHDRDRAHPRALLGLGQLAVARGRFDDARTHLEQAARFAPDARPIQALLAVAYARVGEPDLAARATVRSRQLPPTADWHDPWHAELDAVRTGLNAWLDQADELAGTTAAAQTLPLLRRATTTYPASARAWRTYGFALLNAGRPDEAETALRRATEVAPQAVDAHIFLAHALVRCGQPAQAEAAARRAVALQPAAGDAYTILGIALHAQNRLDEAADALRLAIECRPDLGEAHLAMADLLVARGRRDEAVARLAEAVERVPDDPSLRHRLAELQRTTRAAGSETGVPTR